MKTDQASDTKHAEFLARVESLRPSRDQLFVRLWGKGHRVTPPRLAWRGKHMPCIGKPEPLGWKNWTG